MILILEPREAPKSVGPGGHPFNLPIRICRVEEPGMPGLEPGPERAAEHASPDLKQEMRPDFDQRIYCFFENRFPTTVLTVDSTNAVDTRSPYRWRSA